MGDGKMGTARRITIVTPSYNQGQYIEKTIESVLAQEYPNIEYIVIDGGSTDGTIEILRQYGSKISFWSSEPDHGQSAAIQKGLRMATGEIFAWQNSDDLYAPGTRSVVADTFKRYPEIDLVFGAWRFIDSLGNPLTTRSIKHFSIRELRSGWTVPPQPAVFMRTAAIRQAGGLDISKRYVMDYALYVKIANPKNVAVVDRVCGEFRIHASSKTVSERQRHIQELIQTRNDLLGSQASIVERISWWWFDLARAFRDYLHDRMGFFSFRDLVRKGVRMK